MKTLIILLISLFILSGCGAAINQEDNESYEEPYVAVISLDNSERFTLFTEQRLLSGLYEPNKGIYIGAYILSDRTVAGNIEAFEALTGKEHSFYTYFHKMGQPFPTEWILSSVAIMRTPNIVLTPRNIEEPFNERLLRETAIRLGEIFVPMFVHLYPISNGADYEAESYTAFFRTAREYFDRYAPNVALVWSIDSDALHLINSHYPGEEYSDWVGINIFTDSDMTFDHIRQALDFFYFNFHEKHPVFISQLGISHFSSRNHAYHIAAAVHIMEELFNVLISHYPRIKAVNYMSFNAIDPVNMRQGIYNFSVSDNEIMTRAYNRILSNEHFLSRLDFGAGGNLLVQKMRNPAELLYIDGEFFMRAHLPAGGREALADSYNLLSVGRRDYYPLQLALRGNYTIHPDFNLRTITLRQRQ